MNAIFGGLLGFAVPGMVTSAIVSFMPSLASNQIVTWLVRAVSVFVPGMLLKRFMGPVAGYAYLVVGTATLVRDVLKTYFPTIGAYLGQTTQPLLGYYPGGKIVGMGAYLDRKPRQVPVSTTPVLTGVPDRLNPGSRF